MINNRDIWHDSSGQREQQKPALLGTREFREIDENAATCRLCSLARVALYRKLRRKSRCRWAVLEHDTTIYYSRILFARFRPEDSISTDSKLQSMSPDQQAGFHYTYRLRVSANYQYNVDLTEDPEFVRDFQRRSCDKSYFVSHPDNEGEIMLLCEKTDGDRFSNGRRMNTCLDFNLAKGWIDACVTNHELIEEHGALSKQRSPNRVIEICSRRIVWTPHRCLYAALSYCWGPPGTPQVRLNKITEKDLTEFQGLDKYPIPETIFNAILVCEKLGIGYLWVDALCRPHGEEDEYQNERREKISNIFACAYLTIVGKGNHSHYGLPGVSPSSPRQRQFSEQIGNLHLAVSQPFIDEAMDDSGWRTRTWTYDEYVQSKRLLFFTDHQVFFICKCKGERPFYCEDTHYELFPHDSIDNKYVELPDIDPSWIKHHTKDALKGFMRYELEVQDYVGRQITNPMDRVSAFDSSKNMMEPEVGKDYFHDLPVQHFAQALCFELLLSECRGTAHGSPSWSWQGWDILNGSDIYYDHANSMDFHILIFYRAEKQPKGTQFQFIPVKDYDFEDHVLHDMVLTILLANIQGWETTKAGCEFSESEDEGSSSGESSTVSITGRDSNGNAITENQQSGESEVELSEEAMDMSRSFPNVHHTVNRDASLSMDSPCFPAPEILDTVSSEEKSHIIAFHTIATDLCFFCFKDGYWEVVRPGRENDPIGQGCLNTGVEYGAGSVVKCILIGNSDDGWDNKLFFLVVKEVKENVYCRVGCCTVNDKPKLRDGLKFEMIYLI